ncbi:MAG: CvpA family protein [Thermodesulfobacteriota bacterium]
MEYTPNWLDLALLALLAFFVLKALLRGFIREITGLVGLGAGVVAAMAAYRPLGGFLRRVSALEADWWEAVAFAALFLLVLGSFQWLGKRLARLTHDSPLNLLDRFAGTGVGLIKGVLVAYLVVNLLLLITPLAKLTNPDADRDNPLKQSTVAPRVMEAGRHLLDLLPANLTRDLQERSGLIPPQARPEAKPPAERKR